MYFVIYKDFPVRETKHMNIDSYFSTFLHLVFTSTTINLDLFYQRYSSNFRAGNWKSSSSHIYFSMIASFKYSSNQYVSGIHNVPGTVRNRKIASNVSVPKGLSVHQGRKRPSHNSKRTKGIKV